MKRGIIVLVCVLVLAASVSYAQTQNVWTTYEGTMVIDDHLIDNEGLAWPFLTDGETVYLPMEWYTLRVMGFLSYWDEANATVNVYETTNKLLVFREKSEGPTEPLPPAQEIEASVQWLHDPIISPEKSLINKGGVLYMPLTDAVLEQLGWAADIHPVLGFRLATEPDKFEVGFETDELDYVDALARFMISRNKGLAYEDARSYVGMVRDASETYEIDELWIMAMIWQESWYNASTEYKGAIGLMQIMESTGRYLGLTKAQLFEPETSIHYGVKYLKEHVDMYEGDLQKATLAYNQGSTRVNKGTYKVWYLEEVQEKYEAIQNWLQQEIPGWLPQSE